MGGRKEGSISVADALRRCLKRISEGKDPISRRIEEHEMKDWVAIALVAKAASGDMRAISEVFDRIEGKSVQNVNVATSNAPPMIDVSLDSIYNNMGKAFNLPREHKAIEAIVEVTEPSTGQERSDNL